MIISPDYILVAVILLALLLPVVNKIIRDKNAYIDSFNKCSCGGFITENRDGSICSPSQYCKQHSKRYEAERKKFNITVKERP